VETVGIIVLLLFLIFAALAAVATVRTVRAVKRGVARSTAQARRMVEDTQIKARRYAMPGAAGQLAQLRLDLRNAIDSTGRALDAADPHDASLAEAGTLLSRLNDHARALDGELKILEAEPDRSRIAERLPDLSERVGRVTHSADALRWATQDRARHTADDDLAELSRAIDLEAEALRHWAPVDGPGQQGHAGRAPEAPPGPPPYRKLRASGE
jgi:hypothetical protein